jgi:hypothetical protein
MPPHELQHRPDDLFAGIAAKRHCSAASFVARLR